MAEQFLGPRRGGVTYKIGSQSYATVGTEQEFEQSLGQDDVTTFNDEPSSAWEEGETLSRFRFAARLKDGSTAADPPLPTANQGVTFTQIFGGSNTISGTANLTRLLIRRTVKQVGVLAGEGIYTGAIVKSWITT